MEDGVEDSIQKENSDSLGVSADSLSTTQESQSIEDRMTTWLKVMQNLPKKTIEYAGKNQKSFK